MPIDEWFPLAIYYTDLKEHQHYQRDYLNRIEQLRDDAGKHRSRDHVSWTGDIHKVDRLHHDPAFAWLTEQVGHHALAYLKTLGHDLNKIDLYIQRAWPVIGKKGQWIARHAHHNAHLSAVYYLSVAKEGDAGQTLFYSQGKANELSTCVGASMTDGYREINSLNQQQISYQPTEGRLLLFPAKQPHGVAANQTDEMRISISFDFVITAKSDDGGKEKGEGSPEFLMPSPQYWQKCHTAD